MSDPCFECGAPAEQRHHVVPRSLGGTKTVPLCCACHGKAHGRDGGFRNTRELTKAALGQKRDRGERVGTVPWGWQLGADGKTLEPCDSERAATKCARELRAAGRSWREVAMALDLAGYTTRSGRRFVQSGVRAILGHAPWESKAAQ